MTEWSSSSARHRLKMRDKPTTFWGKLRPCRHGIGVSEWHPLVDHCADVASVVEALVRLPIWRKRLIRLAGRDIDDVGWARLCVLAALHDIGKLNVGFQAKGRSELGPARATSRKRSGPFFVLSSLGSPARAGMYPEQEHNRRRVCGLPRARGCAPRAKSMIVPLSAASPGRAIDVVASFSRHPGEEGEEP